MIERLQYISQKTPEYSHLENIERNCREGVKWVQLRMKEEGPEEVLITAKAAKYICNRYGSRLIINDHTAIALEVEADGVHLGKNDLPVPEARKLLGSNRIIGGTANTFADIRALSDAGADYVGLGPFRFTTTKKNLSPVLGINGYKKIIKKCNDANVTLPVLAIGGILLTDIPAIMETGVHGIALSGVLSGEGNRMTLKTIKSILEQNQRRTIC